MAANKPVLEEKVEVEITSRRDNDANKVYVGCIVNGKYTDGHFNVEEKVMMYPSQIKSLEGRTENVRVQDKKSKKAAFIRKPIYTISKV